METSTSISIIIPAYQEEKRIALTIDAISKFIQRSFPEAELILVCDGCSDATAEIALTINPEIKVINLPQNQGKGAAVKAGMLAASGQYLMFTDSDLSYSPDSYGEFFDRLRNGADICIAQRKKETKYPQLGRRVIATISRALVGNLITPGIRDTQAGLKAFSKSAARSLFSQQRVNRFLFDVEILTLARRKGMKIEKVYVDWQDKPGSTVSPIRDTARATIDLMLIYWRLLTGQYHI